MMFNSTTQSRLLRTLDEKPFKNIEGEGENAFFSFSNNVFNAIKDKNNHFNPFPNNKL